MEDWGWLSPLLLRWPIRYLPRILSKLASLRLRIGGPTPLENCQNALAQCQSKLEAANERHKTELGNLKQTINVIVTGHYDFIHNRISRSQLTAECRDDAHAKKLLGEELGVWRIRLAGVSDIASMLRTHSIISGTRPNIEYRSLIMLYTLTTNGELVEVTNPNKVIAELRELERIPEIKNNLHLLADIQKTIRAYEQELSS